jgi:hypothetical protein
MMRSRPSCDPTPSITFKRADKATFPEPTADKSEKGVTAGEAAAAVGGAAVAVGGAAAAYLSGAISSATNTLPASVTSKLPESVQNSINATSTSQPTMTAKDTPDVVKDSIVESGQAPEVRKWGAKVSFLRHFAP